MDAADRFKADFTCLKCRGREAVAREVSLSGRAALPGLIHLRAAKLIALTCTLCGFTELYDPAAYEKSEERVSRSEPVPQTKPLQ